MKRRRKSALKKRYGHAMPLSVLEHRARKLVAVVRARGGRI
jgi:hypothetical protein